MVNSLFGRILLLASACVLLLFLGFWQWFSLSQQHSQRLVQQSLHRELATHMAEINPLLSQGLTSDAALKEAFHDLMLLGPSFEIYTLDTQGKVIAFDAREEQIKTHRVDITKIHSFLKGDTLPILGTDPRSDGQQKIFSASPLIGPNGTLSGYLYVIIGGEAFDSWQSLIQAKDLPERWGVALGGWALFTLILFALLLRYLTRPLNRLTQALGELEHKPIDQPLALPLAPSRSQEMAQLNGQINRLLEEVAQKQRQVTAQQAAKQEFLLHLSHDLKTPLTTLLGYLDTWLLSPADARDDSLLQYAAASGQKLQQLLAQMLELAALENGQIKANMRRVSLKSILDELNQTFTPKAKRAEVSLRLVQGENEGKSEGEREFLYTDPQLMSRVLNNLLDNALRHTPPGGEIAVYPQTLASGSYLVIQDSGSGMQPEAIAALQHTPSPSQPELYYCRGETLPQLGVGLAIVRQLLARLGCRIEVQSATDRGSRFMIALPRYR
ncbi:HAMP domain-containing histidine kinase [Shewanella alkalitolerans]|uniref:sensor histidine kinase n=1 Tax=Shewanella alkalitolerans TaxID=2864209 RepID=UPI001C654F8B|nr:HAMP domain-containing sensor histidine kinase [Shewanella alkalitolerans]QYJ97280.1 HAMP domain-containing histidine kinase [Shewanella alkalitolerans]